MCPRKHSAAWRGNAAGVRTASRAGPPLHLHPLHRLKASCRQADGETPSPIPTSGGLEWLPTARRANRRQPEENVSERQRVVHADPPGADAARRCPSPVTAVASEPRVTRRASSIARGQQDRQTDWRAAPVLGAACDSVCESGRGDRQAPRPVPAACPSCTWCHTGLHPGGCPGEGQRSRARWTDKGTERKGGW